MTLRQPKQRPVDLADAGKRGVRTQFGALCWRKRADEVQVLLIKSRTKKRWIVPKGWPVDNATPASAAKTEAWEEAGVEGKASSVCLGIFSYIKDLSEGVSAPCVVAVFPVKVKKLHKDFPEKEERQRKWFSQKKAAKLVSDPELGALIKYFDPSTV